MRRIAATLLSPTVGQSLFANNSTCTAARPTQYLSEKRITRWKPQDEIKKVTDRRGKGWKGYYFHEDPKVLAKRSSRKLCYSQIPLRFTFHLSASLIFIFSTWPHSHLLHQSSKIASSELLYRKMSEPEQRMKLFYPRAFWPFLELVLYVQAIFFSFFRKTKNIRAERKNSGKRLEKRGKKKTVSNLFFQSSSKIIWSWNST